MKRLANFVLMLFLIGLVCSSCTDRKLQDRLQWTLKLTQKDQSGHTDSLSQVRARDGALLKALSSATVSNLEHPILVSASYFANRTDVRLLVTWIERSPTPDAVELTSDGHQQVFQIPDEDMKSNIDDARDCVSFNATFIWTQSSDIAAALDSPEKRLRSTVRLMSRGKVCSESVRLFD